MNEINEILTYLPKTFQKAHAAGSYARYDDTEAGDWVPEFCEDCKSWHKFAYALNFVTENSVLFAEAARVDSDGDWDTIDTVEVGSIEYDNLIREYFHCDAHQQAHREYDDYILESGSDPLDFYYEKDPEKRRRVILDSCRHGYRKLEQVLNTLNIAFEYDELPDIDSCIAYRVPAIDQEYTIEYKIADRCREGISPDFDEWYKEDIYTVWKKDNSKLVSNVIEYEFTLKIVQDIVRYLVLEEMMAGKELI